MDRTHPDPVRRLAWRLLATALVAVAAWGSFAEYTQWRRVQGDLAATAERTGLLEQQPDLLRDLRRYVHPEQARVRLGLALLAQELDRRWLEPLTPEEREEQLQLGFERLDAAGELAADVLARQPGSWDASLVLGGSRFLSFSRRNDPRLRSRPELSEGLMLRARQLAPGRPEPARLLSAFYLSNWSRLPQSQRAQAMGILAAALENPTSFDLLIEPWLRVAPSLETALAVIPDEPPFWRRLQRVFRDRGDLERYRDATERLEEAILRTAAERTRTAERQIARGGVREGRQALLAVLGDLRPSVGATGLFSAALGKLPPGPLGDRQIARLGEWLDWALDLCVFTACPLGPDTLERLASLIPRLEPATTATAAAAAGDPAAAERIERAAAPAAGDPAWDAYRLLTARALAGRGDGTAATLLLERLSEGARSSLPGLNARLAAAAASGDGRALQAARAALDERTAVRWPAAAWRHDGDRRLRLSLLAGRSGRLATHFATPPQGAVMEALLDGESLGTFSLLAGSSWQTPEPLPAGAHLVELRLLTSRDVSPGEARLTANG